LLKITIFIILVIFIIMGRLKKKTEDKKQSISIALKPELLEHYRNLHINLSSLINNLLEQYKENGNKSL
jgi:hypothetical protein